MASYNPYDDYDPIDPFDDDTGSFAYVEDEYGSVESYGDGLDDRGFYVDTYDAGYDDAGYDGSGYDGPYEAMGGATDAYPRAYEAVGGSTGAYPRANASAGDSADAFPRTMVRNVPVDPRGGYVQEPEPAGMLRRKNRNGRKARGRQAAAAGQGAYDPYDPRYAGPARQEYQPRPRRRRRHKSHGCLVTLLVFAVALVGLYWVVAHPVDEKLAFSPEEQATVGDSLSFSVPGMPYYVLALGSDAREGETSSRTDTMVLVRVDFWGGKLTLISIPRDTKVEIPGYGTQKINAAYTYGGVGGAVNAVSELCGVPIAHVAVVHFDGLVNLVDYLGGVTVNVPVALSDPYTGLELPAGIQTMDGTTALLWARSRYGYERGDFQRQDDQRILITSIMNRMLSLSPREIPGAIDQLGNLIGTDLRCYDLVPLFLRFRLANPTVYSASVPSTTAMIDGVSYVIADEAALYNMMSVVNAGGDPSTLG